MGKETEVKLPQMLVVAWLAMNLGLSLANPKEAKAFLATLVGTAIWIVLLVWGGFWK